MEQKYELVTSISRTVGETQLYRIKALRTFTIGATQTVVRAGEYGGYIESEANLDQNGTCWVGEEAMAYDNSKVSGDAYVHGRANISGEAKVCGYAEVYGLADVYGSARVDGFAQVHGIALVFGTSVVCGVSQVGGSAVVCDEFVYTSGA